MTTRQPKPLRFHGYSDDTFGEYSRFRRDAGNHGSGGWIAFKIVDQRGRGFIVAGRYGFRMQTWSIEVTPVRANGPVPDWPIRFVKPEPDECAYSPTLVVEAPAGVTMDLIC